MPLERPVGLAAEFATAADARWKAFLRTNDLLDVPIALVDVVALLDVFISPVLAAADKRWLSNQRWIGRRWV
ncbi:hypothetical protein D3C83_210320 [compost metagenome]